MKTLRKLVNLYFDFVDRTDNAEDWESMTDEEIAGYFILSYGIASGAAWVHESNEGLGDCEGWEEFRDSDRQHAAWEVLDKAMKEKE